MNVSFYNIWNSIMCNVAAVGQKVTGQKVSDIGQKLFHFVYLEPFLYIKNLIIY